MVGSVLLVSSLALLPAYILIRVDRVSLESQNRALEESVSASHGNKDRDDLIEARKKMDAINTVFESDGIAIETVATLVDRRPSGLLINSIQYSYKDGRRTTRVSGTIENRAQMQQYAVSLEADSLFDSVTVPVSSLADSSEGIFVITASGDSSL